MGEPYQVYLIARIRPAHGKPAYRCITGFILRWCYGAYPLFSLYRFLRLLSQSENAAAVRAELREIDAKYGRKGEVDNPMPDFPCPYTLSLLATACTANLDASLGCQQHSGYTFRDDMISADIGSCWHCDNGSGLSIVDVTDPLHPSYCILPVLTTRPVSAYEYLHGYYESAADTDEEDEIHMFLAMITYLSGIPLLSADILREVWPEDRFDRRRPVQDVVVVPHDHARSLSDPDYTLRVWETAVQRLLTCPPSDALPFPPDDDEPRQKNSDTAYLKLNTCLLRQPSVFNFRFVSKPLSSYDLQPLFALLPKLGRGGASYKELTALVHARDDIRNAWRKLSPFPDDQLDSLVKLMILGGEPFADLSGYDLSVAQITRFVTQCPDLDSLDISQNPHVVLSDIPTLLAAAPHLRRLNVYGCSGIDGEALLDLVRTQPSLFRTVEAIVHPAFLTLDKPPKYPVAITFMCACALQDTRHGVGFSFPLFTPTQVVQALYHLLPFASHTDDSYYVTGNTGAEHAGDARRRWMFPKHGTAYTIHGLSLESLDSPMAAYAAFSGGSQRPGASWSDRAVVGVPLRSKPSVAPGPEGSWAFYLGSRRPSKADSADVPWAFIRYAAGVDTGEGLAALSLDGELDDTEKLAREVKRGGKVYDLRGFLRCMEEEGRPMPPPELVVEVETLLSVWHKFDGEIRCPLCGKRERWKQPFAWR